MANQTITVDTNHDALTGRTAGDSITIESGATLTINSEPAQTAMGILGDLSTENGVCLIDGTTVRHLAFTGAAGTLNPGDTVTGGTSGATGDVLRDMGTGEVKFRSVTGAFVDAEALSNGSGWTATSSGVDFVGNLLIAGETGGNINGRRQGTIQITGEWFELYTGDGTASQTATHWTTGFLPAMWVETGSGTGVFEKWLNLEDQLDFSDAGVGDYGRFFMQATGSASITFGDGTNGKVVPNGAIVRVPNLQIVNSTVAAAGTPVHSTSFTSMYEFNTNNNPTVVLSKCTFSPFNGVITQAFDLDVESCSFYRSFNVTEISDSVSIVDIGVTNPESTADVTLDMSSLPDNIAITNVMSVSHNSEAFRILRASDGNITDCVFMSFLGTGLSGCLISDLVNFTISGGICMGEFSLFTATGCTVEDIEIAGLPSGANFTNSNADAMVLTDVVNSTLSGFTTSAQGLSIRDEFITIIDCSEIVVRDIGTQASPIDISGGTADSFMVCSTGAKNITVANCHVTGGTDTNAFLTINTASNITYQNLSSDANSELTMGALTMVAKGIQGIGSNFGDSTSVETDLTAVFRANYGDVFMDSGTEGYPFIIMTEGTDGVDYNIIAGTPFFNSLGDLSLLNLNDEIEFEWPYTILGHESFQNVTPLARTSGTSAGLLFTNQQFTYDIDTGSGYSGSFSTLNGTNLSGETISASDGFKLKIRIKCIVAGTSTGNIINGLALRTNTSQASIDAAQYLVNPATVTLTGAVEGSSWAAIDSVGGTIATGTIPVSGSDSFVADRVIGTSLEIRVRKAGLSPFELTTTIPSTDTTINVVSTTLVDIDNSPLFGRGPGTTTSLLSIDFPSKRVDIADGVVIGEDLYDFCATQESNSTGILNDRIMDFNGTDTLLLNSWQLRREDAGDTAAGVDIFVGTISGEFDDEVNGSLTMRPRTVRTLANVEDAVAFAQIAAQNTQT